MSDESLLQDAYTGTRVLTTGSSGYIASNVHAMLDDVDCTIIRLSRDASELPARNGQATYVDTSGDIGRLETWEEALEGVDVVFHLAAQTSTYEANEDPVGDLEANVLPMVQLLEACKGIEAPPRVVFSGTVTEIGIPTSLPVDESHPADPLTVYDAHKLASERYLRMYAQLGHVEGATLRLSNVYGPGPESSSQDRGILNMMIRRALSGEPITVYGEGTPVRDHTYIDDVVRAFLLAGRADACTDGQGFVVGTGQGASLARSFGLVARRVEALTGQAVQVEHVDPPSGLSPIESRDFIADPRAFIEATGWWPAIELETGIDRTIEAFVGAPTPGPPSTAG